MGEARSLVNKLNIPNSPRNRDVVYKRRLRNPLSGSEIDDEPRTGRMIEKKMIAVIALMR